MGKLQEVRNDVDTNQIICLRAEIEMSLSMMEKKINQPQSLGKKDIK